MADWVAIGTILGVLGGVFVVYFIVYFIAKFITRTTKTELDDELLRAVKYPLLPIAFSVALLVTFSVLDTSNLDENAIQALEQVILVVAILCAGWLLLRLVNVLDKVVMTLYEKDKNEYHQRAVQTRLVVLKRTLFGLIILIDVGAVLLMFPTVRELGVGMLASAGVASLVIGIAASPTLQNLVASLQIAITQPIKIGDVVIMEGEWGIIEEICSTYVVVKIWDDRRLIIPLSKIIDTPFQNWTRGSSQLLGTVFLHVDYTAPLDAMRKKLQKICERSTKYDGRHNSLVVTDVKEGAMEVRCLVSAQNASDLSSLRFEVREKLIKYLVKHHPKCLVKTRITSGDEKLRITDKPKKKPPQMQHTHSHPLPVDNN